MNRYGLLLTTVLLTNSVPLQAGWWGTFDGRSANPENNPRVSIEGFVSKSNDDYQNIGGRLNYTVNESLTVFGDNGLNWYATAGFTKQEFDRPGRVYVGNEFIRTSPSSDDIEPHLGAGIYLPLGPGTL